MTGHGDIAMSVRAMKAGAVEFLTKPFRDQDLLDAIHLAIGRDLERRRETALLAELQDRYGRLTERERQVLHLVVDGRANKQIAGELKLSEMTIKVHRGQMMRKMKARSLPELVRMADRIRLGTATLFQAERFTSVVAKSGRIRTMLPQGCKTAVVMRWQFVDDAD